MGWYGQYGVRTASQVKKDILEELAKNSKIKILKVASTSYGRNLWLACEHPENGERFIALYLIKAGQDASYKPMDEGCGPCEVDCPLALLDMTEAKVVAGRFNMTWRAKVRAFHQTKTRSFQSGQQVKVFGKSYTVIRKEKRKWIIENESGNIYKASPQDMEATA